VSIAIVTVDGPAGSGKSTLGRRLAAALGLPYIDTGLFYRAVTVAALRAGLGAGDVAAIGAVAGTTRIEVNTIPEDESWEVRVDGVDPGAAIRDPRHAALLTAVSQVPAVRHHLLALQRAPARGGAVAVGRDCGTVVFPDAAVKLYLQATEELRAARRAAQIASRGSAVDRETLTSEIAGRDLGDAPALAAAPDAVIIDTGRHDVDEMVSLALALCAAAGIAPPGPPR
jgi:cytidylate kinase